MVGLDIAAKVDALIRTGPGTKKQSPVWLIIVGRAAVVHDHWPESTETSGPHMLRIGLAMLQGARHEHSQAIRSAATQLGIEIEIIELRKAMDIVDIDALILPGGESTTMRIASQSEQLLPALYEWMSEEEKRPVLGTCAGAILLATPEHGNPLVPIEISRNGFGRQRDSFQADILVEIQSDVETIFSENQRDTSGHLPLPLTKVIASSDFPGVFIRAPRFEDTKGVQDIAWLGDEVVGVRHHNRIALTFHPELTGDHRFHRWLIEEAMA